MNKLNVGDLIKLDIRQMGINGEGIGYYNKLAVFVPGAIIKETVWVEITKTFPNRAIGKISSFIRKSTKRVEPFCKYYDKCGACSLQHIEYSEQLKIKQKLVIQALKKYTDLEIDVEKTVRCDEDNFDYRNKSQMPFKDTNFDLCLGLYQNETNNFIYVDECKIQKKLINQINNEVLKILRRYNQKTFKNGGVLKNLVVRSTDLNQVQVTFIISEFREVFKEIAQKVLELKEVKSVYYSLSGKDDYLIFSDKTYLLAGNTYIKDDFLGLSIKLSPSAFYQLNKAQAQKLYLDILNEINFTGNEIVIDGYSGIGIIGMLMSKKAKHVYSIDLNKEAIQDGKVVALENGIKNITFYNDRLESRLDQLFKDNIIPDILIFDPPRTGLDEKVIKSLLNHDIKKIYYISCNPSTLAKNLSELSKKYDVEYIKPYDFFYSTAHVETVCCLVKR